MNFVHGFVFWTENLLLDILFNGLERIKYLFKLGLVLELFFYS